MLDVHTDLPQCTSDDPFLLAAYSEAMDGYLSGGIPIGSVLVRDGEIIGRGHNMRVQGSNPILHGEMSCMQNAGRLSPATYRTCTIYTTQSPCSMCAGTMLLFGIPKVVIGESITGRARTYNYLNSGKSCDEFLRSMGLEVTVHDDPACAELLTRFTLEQPEVWAEDIGDIGDGQDPMWVRRT